MTFKISWDYLHGIFVYWAVSSLRADFMGKEAYIKEISENWISGEITIPIAIGVLVFVTLHSIAMKIKEDANK